MDVIQLDEKLRDDSELIPKIFAMAQPVDEMD